MAEDVKAENKEEGKDAPKDDAFQKDVAEKLQTYEDELKTLKDSNLQLGQVLNDTNRKVTEGWQPAPKEPTKTFADLLYEDEEKAIQMIEDRTEKRIMKKLGANQNVEAQRTKALGKLYGEYPELGSQDSELSKKALDMYGAMSKEDQQNPMAYNTVVRDAASELSILPKKMRPADQVENFSLGAGHAPDSAERADSLDPLTEQFAELVGKEHVDLSNKDTVERLKGYQRNRKDWGKYKKP